jgi:signal transduction histidine kinase
MGDLLDYGRPAPLELLSGGLVEPIREALRSCAPAAARAGVTLAADLEDFSLELMRDPGRLEQVFENLLSNAIQHSRAGATVRVRKAAGDAAPPGSVACLIEDEGPGIPEQDLARVFEPFFSRRRGGTGLGLAIVQRIVDDHGGSVRAANRPTGGAVFTVLLPLREARPGSRPPFAAGPPAGEPPRLPA